MATQANIKVDTSTDRSSVKVINVSGELDESNLPELENVMNPLIKDENNKVIILNFNGLKFMGSKLIGMFAAMYATLNHSQRQIVFAEMNQTITDIVTFVGLNRIIPCYPTLDEALKVIDNQ